VPRYYVLVHIRGPFQYGEGRENLDGAYTHRFLVADDEGSARERAIDEVSQEESFRQFRAADGTDAISIEIVESRPMKWRERMRRVKGYTFYRESADEGQLE
jgi:hypothetical protein